MNLYSEIVEIQVKMKQAVVSQWLCIGLRYFHPTYLKRYGMITYNVFNTHFKVLTEIDGPYNLFQQYPLIHDDITTVCPTVENGPK